MLYKWKMSVLKKTKNNNYRISFLVLTFIFFVFSLMFTHVNRRQMCLFYTEFRNSQNK